MIGISEGFHDAAISVVNNGEIKFASHAERYSRLKNDKSLNLPVCAEALLHTEDEIVAFYERPWLKRTRQFFAGQYESAFKHRNIYITPSHYYSHHLSHAAAAFQTSSYQNAACVVVDSIGEWDTASIWHAQMVEGRAKYKKVWSQKYPNSIGLWYSAYTKWAGLRPLDEEYIFMGMAAFGKPLYVEQARKLLSKNNHKGFPISLEGTPEDNSKSAEVVLCETLKGIFKKAGSISNNICYGGGVALNCVVNAKLQREYPSLWIMPNPGDAGASLGAALLSYGGKVNFTPYLGFDIKRYLDPKDVVDVLLRKGMCGVANGRAEFGPRALGNRSLLADPRTPQIKDLVNTVKKRQKFRPFAPAILEEYCQDYFDMSSDSRYMSFVYDCMRPNEIPACVHVDNTARVQTVPIWSSSILREILECWYERTGCPVLLNTSLNIRGMPIVNTWEDAKEFSKTYGIDVF
jgi:carbamoyltransferase